MAPGGDHASKGFKTMTEQEIKELEDNANYIVQQLRIACSDQGGECFYEEELQDLTTIVTQLTTELRKGKVAKGGQYVRETRH